MNQDNRFTLILASAVVAIVVVIVVAATLIQVANDHRDRGIAEACVKAGGSWVTFPHVECQGAK